LAAMIVDAATEPAAGLDSMPQHYVCSLCAHFAIVWKNFEQVSSYLPSSFSLNYDRRFAVSLQPACRFNSSSVRPFLSFHSTLPFVLRPLATKAAALGEPNK